MPLLGFEVYEPDRDQNLASVSHNKKTQDNFEIKGEIITFAVLFLTSYTYVSKLCKTSSTKRCSLLLPFYLINR